MTYHMFSAWFQISCLKCVKVAVISHLRHKKQFKTLKIYLFTLRKDTAENVNLLCRGKKNYMPNGIEFTLLMFKIVQILTPPTFSPSPNRKNLGKRNYEILKNRKNAQCVFCFQIKLYKN